MTQNIDQDGVTEQDDVVVPRQTGRDQLSIPRQAGTPAEVWIPSQAGSSDRHPDHSGPIPRPFAHGATAVDEIVAAPPEEAGPRTARTRRPYVIGGVLGVVLIAVAATAVIVTNLAARDVDPGRGAPLHQVTYQVSTEHGTPVVISYSQVDAHGDYAMGDATDVPSPWSVDTKVNSYYGPSMTAGLSAGPDGQPADDAVTCTVVQDGAVIAHETASGADATVSCFGR